MSLLYIIIKEELDFLQMLPNRKKKGGIFIENKSTNRKIFLNNISCDFFHELILKRENAPLWRQQK